MTIRTILHSKGDAIQSISGDALVSDAVALLAEKRIGALPVMDSGQVRGIFSERDVVYGLAQKGASILSERVADVMTSPAMTVEPQSSVIGALSLMTRRRVRHLPVTENGAVIGFVSIGDLVKYRIDHIQAEAEALRDYIAS